MVACYYAKLASSAWRSTTIDYDNRDDDVQQNVKTSNDVHQQRQRRYNRSFIAVG